jgi:hypothetical protein
MINFILESFSIISINYGKKYGDHLQNNADRHKHIVKSKAVIRQ